MSENKVRILKVLPSVSFCIMRLVVVLATSMQIGLAGVPDGGGAAGAQLG